MSKAFLPAIAVPGAQRVSHPDTHAPLFDKKGRPIWSMPLPLGMVRHFLSAGARRKFEAGEITYEDATKPVPFYRGIGVRALQVVKATIAYQRKLELRARNRSVPITPETGGIQ